MPYVKRKPTNIRCISTLEGAPECVMFDWEGHAYHYFVADLSIVYKNPAAHTERYIGTLPNPRYFHTRTLNWESTRYRALRAWIETTIEDLNLWQQARDRCEQYQLKANADHRRRIHYAALEEHAEEMYTLLCSIVRESATDLEMIGELLHKIENPITDEEGGLNQDTDL